MSAKPNVGVIETIPCALKKVNGADYPGYRNHVVRMATLCLALGDCREEEQRKIETAAYFHDIGLWTAKTFDHIAPSVEVAKRYLAANGLDHWAEEIELRCSDCRPSGSCGIRSTPPR